MDYMRIKTPDCCVYDPEINVKPATNRYNNRGMLYVYVYHTIKVNDKCIKCQGAL